MSRSRLELRREFPSRTPCAALGACPSDERVFASTAIDLPDDAPPFEILDCADRPAVGGQKVREVVNVVCHGVQCSTIRPPEIQRPPVARAVAMRGRPTWNQAREQRNASGATTGGLKA